MNIWQLLNKNSGIAYNYSITYEHSFQRPIGLVKLYALVALLIFNT